MKGMRTILLLLLLFFFSCKEKEQDSVPVVSFDLSENQTDVEYSLKKGYAPEVVALDKLPKKLKREKASRLTIKIDGYDLTPYKSLMESLWKVGVKSHITNEEKDVENTYHTDSRKATKN